MTDIPGLCVGPPATTGDRPWSDGPHFANTTTTRPWLRDAPLCDACVQFYKPPPEPGNDR